MMKSNNARFIEPPTAMKSATNASTRASRWIRALLTAAFLGLMIPAASARAEIIDFHPIDDAENIPEILDAGERARIQTLTNTGFVYFFDEPNAEASHVYTYLNGRQGMLDLASGEMIDLPDDLPGFLFEPPREDGGPPAKQYASMGSGWTDDGHYLFLQRQIEIPDEPDPSPVFTHHAVRFNPADGSYDSLPVGWMDAAMPNGIVSMHTGFGTGRMLVMRPRAGEVLAEPERIRIGPPVWEKSGPMPEGLPGRTGEGLLGTMELQQQEVSLVVLDIMDGSEVASLDLTIEEDAGIDGVSWDVVHGRLSVLTRYLPDWDGDRQRDNNPPGEGLPNLGSFNVQEALGNVPAEENPLVTGTLIQVYDLADGSLEQTISNTDHPEGLLAGLQFGDRGEYALLAIALRSELEGRANPTYAYPSGNRYHLLDGELELVREVEIEGLDNAISSISIVSPNLVAVIADETNTRVVAQSADEPQDTQTVWDQPGTAWQAIQTPAGLLISHQTVNHPMEAYFATIEAVDGEVVEETRRVTSINPEAAAASDIVAEPVSWTSSKGRQMEGIYIHHASQAFPPTEPGPVVVWQQGGPGGQMENGWGGSVESPYSVLPNVGIPVFLANAAGRNVKDAQFYSDMAEGRNFGQLDIEQIKEGVEHLNSEGIVDLDRVGVTGCSYGGYFTLQSIRTYPDFYAAANPQCSLADLTEEFTFGYTPFISYLMGRAPMADIDEYLKDSPMYGTNQVKTPTLIFHGRNDFLPFQLINNIHDQIEENGTEVTFLRVAEEGHGFGFPTSQAYAQQLQIDFFRRHLGIDAFTPPTSYEIFLPALGLRWDTRSAGE